MTHVGISELSNSMARIEDSPQSSNRLNLVQSGYRPEIDGLRAFAVIAVIINHFNKDFLPSGYLGVDIFFVISGYVITSSLSGRESKSFGEFLSGFYQRRLKRLVPALVVFVLLTSILICLFNSDPAKALKTGIASLFGLSNLYLFKQSTDYFAQSTELNPFTHTWSLGVEEQFYLLFPFLIWFSGFGKQSAKGARNLVLLVGVLTVASLIGFIYLYYINQPAAYFLMLPRFWEMAAGCLLFIGFHKRAKIEQVLERVPPLLVVLAMIGVMFLPVAAAVPATISVVVLSAVLISCLKKGTAAYKFFTLEKVVYIGLISYSLYLWHWTVLAISRWTIGVTWWSALPFLAIIYACAIASYEWIEKPFRSRKYANPFWIFSFGATSLIATAGTVAALSNPIISQKLILDRGDIATFQRGRQSQVNYIGPVTKRKNVNCSIAAHSLSKLSIRSSIRNCFWEEEGANKKLPIVAILGDSHAHQLFPIAEEIAKKKGMSVLNFAYWGCLVPQDPASTTESKCKDVNKVPMWVFEELRRPVIFVIASIADPVLQFPSNFEQKAKASAFKTAFKDVLSHGNYLIVVAPNPKFLGFDNTVSDICGRGGLTRLNPLCSKENASEHKFVANSQKNQRKVYLEALSRWEAEDSRVKIVDPFEILCGEIGGYCYATSNGQTKYWDFSHLNIDAVLSTYPLYDSAIKQLIKFRPG